MMEEPPWMKSLQSCSSYNAEPTAHCWCSACQDCSVLTEKITKRALPNLSVLVSYFCGTLKTRGALNEVAKMRYGINIRGVPATTLATDKTSSFFFFFLFFTEQVTILKQVTILTDMLFNITCCYIQQYAMQILLQNTQQWLWVKISQQKH